MIRSTGRFPMPEDGDGRDGGLGVGGRSNGNSQAPATGAAPPTSYLLPPDLLTLTTAQIAALLGKSRSAAARLIVELEANRGLRRKGRGAGTCYDRQEFLDAWHHHDTRGQQKPRQAAGRRPQGRPAATGTRTPRPR